MRATSSWLFFAAVALSITSAGCSGCGGGETPPEFDGGPGDLDATTRDGTIDVDGSDVDGGDVDAAACTAIEVCNGVDDDCNGEIDEAVSEACGTDVGACVSGIAACVAGAPGTCVGAVGPATETCNGLDDDCNGMTDETCPCSDGELQPCGSDVGECAPGTQTCTTGAWGACVGETGGTAETCNGLDDNCDGATDEGFAVGASCDGADSDLCTEGTTSCSADGSGTVCSDASGDDVEVCDGTLDEDCDLSVDEGCVCTTGMTLPCGSDVGECAAGIQTCVDGTWGVCSGTIDPVTELCNGLDDDCDGTNDNGLAGTISCGVGACAASVPACVGGAPGTCTAGTPGVESCNAIDDDCNGVVDDGITPLSCGVGACAATAPACVGGAPGVCAPGTPSAEVCNGLDDDCDGANDNGLTGTTSCGVGACAATAPVCVGGAPGVCTPGTPSAEVCNGLDDDCDGTNDNGLTGTTSCGVGACVATAPECVAGMPGVCTPGAPGAETCNGIDDDCNGSVDDGLAPLSCGVGACAATAPACVGGAPGTCMPGAPSAETCNGLDDDCDGSVDEGLPVLSCGVGACAATAPSCVGGLPGTCTPGPAGVETCNGIDDDCDGAVDDGNPGGGVSCGGADVGACIARTTCVGGAITCRGTFVSPLGTAGGDGSRASPLASISAAIANATILGGGADVCVCDTSAAGASTFTENVTMVEGTSVLGAYDCTAWTRPGSRTTGIQNLDDDGVSFPAGITSVTALDSMSVDGFDRAGLGVTTAAITITNSSPTLTADTVRAGDAATAIGLRVVETGLTTAAPTITGGAYSALGIASGTAIAVSLEASSPRFSMVAIGGLSVGGAPAATTAYGVRCTDCAGTTFSGGNVTTSGATTTGYGFYGSGDLTGVTAMGTSFGGGMTSGAMSTSFGVRLAMCTGAPTWTSANTNGGFPGSVAGTTRTAFSTSGAACAPAIDGGQHIGCELGVNCYGIDCDGGSQCVVRNAATVRATAGTADVAVAMRCRAGACASITGSTFVTGPLTRSGPTGIGMELDGASPSVDDNTITGPNGGVIAIAGSRWFGVYLRATRSVLTNNLMFSGSHAQPQAVVQYDQTATGPALIAPTIHSNTIEYVSCTGCGARTGLVVNGSPGALLSPMGIVRNTIIRHVGVGGITTPVVETNVQSDLQFFENNVLYEPGAAATLYLDEGTTPLTTAAAINLLAGAAANQRFDCALTATWHIPNSAPNGGTGCRNTGTATGAPDHDFDPNRRPLESGFDIGADEFVP